MSTLVAEIRLKVNSTMYGVYTKQNEVIKAA